MAVGWFGGLDGLGVAGRGSRPVVGCPGAANSIILSEQLMSVVCRAQTATICSVLVGLVHQFEGKISKIQEIRKIRTKLRTESGTITAPGGESNLKNQEIYDCR